MRPTKRGNFPAIPRQLGMASGGGGGGGDFSASASANVFLPTVSSAPTAVYGTRTLVSGWVGALYRLVRSSDSATMDISALAGLQEGDLSGVAAWAGADLVRVDTLYDQSGGGFDVTQATTAAQPTFRLTTNSYRNRQLITFGFNAATGAIVSNQGLTNASKSTDRRACSIYHVSCFPGGGTANMGAVIGSTAAAQQLNLFSSQSNANTANTFTVKTAGAGNIWSGVLIPTGGTSVIAARCGAGSSKLSANSVSETVAAHTAQTMTGLTIGRDSVNAAFTSYQDWGATVIYDAQLSDADHALVLAALYTNYDVFTGLTKKVLFVPHSLVYDINGKTWTRTTIRQIEPLLNERVFMGMLGVPGRQINYYNSNLTELSSKYDAATTKQIWCIRSPCNDIINLTTGFANNSFTGDTHSGTKIIDNCSTTANMVIGQPVTGTGMGVGAVISSIDSVSQITVSVNSTASAATVALITTDSTLVTSAAATIYTNINTLITSIKAFGAAVTAVLVETGWQIISTVYAGTTVDRAAKKMVMTTLNASIISGAVANGYTVVDSATVTQIDTEIEAGNTGVTTDGIHPNETAIGFIAPGWATAINALL